MPFHGNASLFGPPNPNEPNPTREQIDNSFRRIGLPGFIGPDGQFAAPGTRSTSFGTARKKKNRGPSSEEIQNAWFEANPDAAVLAAYKPRFGSPLEKFLRGTASRYFTQYKTQKHINPSIGFLDFLKTLNPDQEYRIATPQQLMDVGIPSIFAPRVRMIR